ncbi:MAG: Na+:solute symporter, partial [Leptospirales bacterium]|nr:Na+:solute symporter [Leptospirales bacterium]
MGALDIIIICAYFALTLCIALFFSKRAGRSSEDFFLSGRKLPWWIAGTTMVATTFGADTPLSVTELVAASGIAGNWLWWNMAAGNILTVLFFSKLWRRAKIITDVELIEIRYSGKPAAFLRGFRAVYLGLFMNAIIMGWINVALAQILKILFDIPDNQLLLYVFASMAIVGIYSAVSGLWGIAFTDMFQFVVAMIGCIILAVVITGLPQIGGIAGLKEALPANVFNFFPDVGFTPSTVATGALTLSFSAFMAYIAIQWWASWYPGSEPGGGGYVAQRIMSSKDEKHARLATLWFTIAHYAVRPWPWIIVALASLVLYPDLAADNKKAGFILAMRDHLPAGLLGLLAAAFLAAYMSTISSHLNWGSSYLVNDLYRRFIKTGASESHYVLASRAATVLLVIISGYASTFIHSISGAWAFLIECGAGLGLVLILRWFWWRVNAWSEISAMIAPFAGIILNKAFLGLAFPESMFFIVALTTAVWLTVTFLTAPENIETLRSFYLMVKPGGPGWKKVS